LSGEGNGDSGKIKKAVERLPWAIGRSHVLPVAAPAIKVISMPVIIAASIVMNVSVPVAPKSRKAESASRLHRNIRRRRIDIDGLRAGVNRLWGNVNRYIRGLAERNTETDTAFRKCRRA
jgi:hypothetical protein